MPNDRASVPGWTLERLRLAPGNVLAKLLRALVEASIPQDDRDNILLAAAERIEQQTETLCLPYPPQTA